LVAGARDRRHQQTLLIVAHLALDKLGCIHDLTNGRWEINNHFGHYS
jgi:hypothetical protein